MQNESLIAEYINIKDNIIPDNDYIDLTSYTTEFYNIPSMGYLQIHSNESEIGTAQILNSSLIGVAISAPLNGYNSLLVFKGTLVRHFKGEHLRFYPILKL